MTILFYVELTETVNESIQVPPVASVVKVVPWIVNISKSRRKWQISEIIFFYYLACFYSSFCKTDCTLLYKENFSSVHYIKYDGISIVWVVHKGI